MIYAVKQRTWPAMFKPLKKPWGLYRNDKIIGVYRTQSQAMRVLTELEKMAS